MTDKLKVVVLNGSPHASIGNTSMMVQMMRSKLEEYGIVLEEIFLSGFHIEYCIGCGVCMEKGKCWRKDDYNHILEKLLDADGIILASPVYFMHVTAQMKTFIDRSLSYGHKPRTNWKPGMAISVSAGMAECSTADYLARTLRVFGAFSVGTLTAISVSPGAFLGKETVQARAKDLSGDLARAIIEKRRYPATEHDLSYYLFVGNLVKREKNIMSDDFRHWQESGLYNGFESYIQQNFTDEAFEPEFRKGWIRNKIEEEVSKIRGDSPENKPRSPETELYSAKNCRELLKMMPLGFNKDAAGNLEALYQFEISGTENFISHLKISGGQCIYADGPGEKADIIIKSPADVWLSVSNGELDGQSAFMSGKYRVEGDIALLLKLKSLFSRTKEPRK